MTIIVVEKKNNIKKANDVKIICFFSLNQKMYEILVNNDGDEKEVEEYLKIVKEYIGGQ